MTIKAMVDEDAKCDICERPLRRCEHFYDAATSMGWGWLCRTCFLAYGRGLGTGLGQEYDSETLEKTRG